MRKHRLFSLIVISITILLSSCKKDSDLIFISGDSSKFPVVEFYYKGNCIGVLNDNNQHGSIEIPDSLVGNVGEKIEIEARMLSGSGVFLNNSSYAYEDRDLYLPDYFTKTESFDYDVTINSIPYRLYNITSLEINKKTIIPRTFKLEFDAWDNNGEGGIPIHSYFYVTFSIKGERIMSAGGDYEYSNSTANFKTIHLDSNEQELFFSTYSSAYITICKEGTEFNKEEWIGWMKRDHIEFNDQSTICYYSIKVSKNDSGEPRKGSLVFKDGPYKKIPVIIIEQDSDR